MTGKFELKRTVQCDKCPWKKGVNPHDIPDGYSVEAHKALAVTIAKDGDSPFRNAVASMACHETNPSEETYCVGWLQNQLGVGNNIPLRIKMTRCSNIHKLKTIGEQHACFNDTLPK